MAQQVAHRLGKAEVTGPNPVISSINGVLQCKMPFFFAFLGIFYGTPLPDLRK